MTCPCVLFVDDEPKVREGIRRTMNDYEAEWEMAFAANGAEALAVMEGRAVAVVVTDIAMPVMDGKTLITHLYESFPDVVVLVLSGHWSASVSAHQLGPCVRFLAKPTGTEALVAAIREALAESRLTAYPREPSAASVRTRSPLAPGAQLHTDETSWVDLVENDD